MSNNTILATAPLTATGYHLKATGTTLGQSLIWDNGTNVGINTASPVSTNLVGSQTIVKSYNSDTPVSTTAQTYYTNQSNLYLFGRNAGISIICPATSEEGSIFFGNSLSVAYASINTGSGTTSVGGDMNFRVGSNTTRMTITSTGNVGINGTPDVALQVKAASGTTSAVRIGSTASGFELSQENVGYTVCNVKNIYGSTSALAELSLQSGFITFKTDTSSTERMRITSGGNININMPNSTNRYLSWYSANGTYQVAGISSITNPSYNDSGYLNFSTARTSSGGFTMKMTINPNGNIGVTTDGTQIYNPSDKRLKRNIETISSGLKEILELNPVKYNWIEGFSESEKDKVLLGFIAQEVEKVIPEAVEGFSDGNTLKFGDTVIENPLRVSEKFIIPVLVKAIQEQNQIIQELNERLNKAGL